MLVALDALGVPEDISVVTINPHMHLLGTSMHLEVASTCVVDTPRWSYAHQELALYREPALAKREIPTLAMLCAPVAEVQARAERCAAVIAGAGIECTLEPSTATVGAGAFPTAALPVDSDWGLHPALAESIQPLYAKGEAAFIPFAGTHDTSRSHFETQDSIELGQAQGNRSYASGFMNRLAAELGGRNMSELVQLCRRLAGELADQGV